jgi:1-acyl-sn-glycerol-3-phosphate acyltransferase
MVLSQKKLHTIHKQEPKNILRGIYTWLNIIVLSILYSSTIIILFPIVYLFDKERHSLHKLASLWALSISKFNPWWKFNIRGRENLAAKGEVVIYVANHQSQADILALFTLSTRFRWLSKASLFKIPIFGWGMSAVGYVPVDRSSKSSSEKSIKLSARHLKKGTPMIFFPEGTRSKTGALGEFKAGAFRLAKSLNIPIVPITVDGCADMLPKGSIWPRMTKVTITVHPKINSTNLTASELMLQAKEAISSKLR